MKWPLNSKLLSELSSKGKTAFSLPACDVDGDIDIKDTQLLRDDSLDLPELSELESVRHYTRLSHQNYSIDGGFYPLGSCTMKYNPRINEYTSSHPSFLNLHPLTPTHLAQGALEAIYSLQNILKKITGFHDVCMQPAAGAQGEYAGIKMIRAYHEKNGQSPDSLLIPESAHGTNCATATMCGYKVIPIRVGASGILELSQIEEKSRDGNIAGIMITNPNTLGLFESQISEISDLIHERGGLVYCDGANMNALLGVSQPARADIDVMHLNLHKTFTTPHGGGGPGCGAIGVSTRLAPFIPSPKVEFDGKNYILNNNETDSIGSIKDFYGHFLMMLRALTYIKELGEEGIKKAGQDAITLANFVRAKLSSEYHVAYDKACMHEVIISDKKQKEYGANTLDIAKKLLDYGYHPPTVYFPLVVEGAMMIEPTETESFRTISEFCDTLLKISKDIKDENVSNNEYFSGPHNTPVGRVDETMAARKPILTWRDI